MLPFWATGMQSKGQDFSKHPQNREKEVEGTGSNKNYVEKVVKKPLIM